MQPYVASSSEKTAESGKLDIETMKCSFCNKDIPASKFRIHEVMCARMNYICKKCGMCVPKAEKEDHDSEVCGRPIDQKNICLHISPFPSLANVSSDDDAVNKVVN